MPKPSERIKEIYRSKKITQFDIVDPAVWGYFQAITDYLDEEHEKGACSRGEHDFKNENLNGNEVGVCQKCHVITTPK